MNCEIPDEKNFTNVERMERNGKSGQRFGHLVRFIFFGKPTLRHYIYIDFKPVYNAARFVECRIVFHSFVLFVKVYAPKSL